MWLVNQTLPTAEENLALDELLLDEAEEAPEPREILRLWESPEPLVVLGRSSKIDIEVERAECARRGMKVLRRLSGGATVVVGPGCLMYAVVLSYERHPELRAINLAHQYVMVKLVTALGPLVPGVQFQGTCDLTWNHCKFSGNALRCRREHLLYHGTLLYEFPLELIEACLKMPPRMPDYRDERPHGRFVTNLPTTAVALRAALQNTWQAHETYTTWNRKRVAELAARRYSQAEWNIEGLRDPAIL